MAIEPKPIKVTQKNTGSYSGPDPEPVEIIGTIPAGAVPAPTETALPATPATFADLAAARTAVEALRSALASSPYFS